MKNLFLTIITGLLSTALFAQSGELLNLKFEVRADYMQDYVSGNKVDANSGFKAKYLNIRMDGNFNENFSYSFRHRLNKMHKDASFFDATDWVTLTYTNKNWNVSAGKQVVYIGGYEYDRAPIDLYFCSEFWNNISCYQLGVSGGYTTNKKNDSFILQFCQSPFRGAADKEMFAYNFIWYGSHDIFSTMYSVNMMEYLPGRFINYIALGNRFDLGQVAIELDIMNRAADIDEFFGKDMSFMGEVQWQPIPCLNIFARASYDFNNSNNAGDYCVIPGTDIYRVGGGIEYYPIKDSKDVRLHLNCCYTDGNETLTGVLRPKQTIIDAGVTWKINLLNIKRKNQ